MKFLIYLVPTLIGLLNWNIRVNVKATVEYARINRITKSRANLLKALCIANSVILLVNLVILFADAEILAEKVTLLIIGFFLFAPIITNDLNLSFEKNERYFASLNEEGLEELTEKEKRKEESYLYLLFSNLIVVVINASFLFIATIVYFFGLIGI